MKKTIYTIIVIISSCVTFIWLLYSNKDYPGTNDEKAYTLCARSFIEWTKSPDPFSQKNLFKYWDVGYEHPSIVKILSGITWKIFHNKVGELVSCRLATMINFSLLIVVLYIFSSPLIGKTIAMCSSIFLLCIPDVVEYAHFAEININLSIFWFLIALFFMKGLKTKYWIYVSGIIFGLALGSKITTLIIPIAILAWILIYKPEKSISSYIIFLLIGVLTFVLLWPSLWFDFPSKLIEHTKFHASSIAIAPSKPWYFAIKTFFSGIPLGLNILFIVGIIGVLIERNKLGMLSLINVFVMFVISFIPQVYPGEGMRYFLPIIPFVTILCATGLGYLITPVIKRKITYV